MSSATTQRLTFTATLDCHYLLQVPERVDERTLLVAAVHGYGMNAEVMLRLTSQLVGEDKIIASLEAPNQFYLSQNQPGSEIGFNWGTRAHWESSIRLHHEMVLRVARESQKRLAVSPARTLLVGFSQPVGLNYRLAATWPGEIHGVIGICGGVPRDWEQRNYGPITASLLHIARQEDQYYPPAVAQEFADRLKQYASDVEFHMMDGPHRFPSKARHIVGPWMDRVFG